MYVQYSNPELHTPYTHNMSHARNQSMLQLPTLKLQFLHGCCCRPANTYQLVLHGSDSRPVFCGWLLFPASFNQTSLAHDRHFSIDFPTRRRRRRTELIRKPNDQTIPPAVSYHQLLRTGTTRVCLAGDTAPIPPQLILNEYGCILYEPNLT